MRNVVVNISALTKSELESIRSEANFTSEQGRMYDLLNQDLHTDAGIMLIMGLSPRRYYKIKKIVCDKTDRIAQEKGYTSAIR